MSIEPNCEALPEIVDEFRAAGGLFDNLTIHYSRERGFFGYAVDPATAIDVFCPRQLLVRIEDIGVSEDGLFIASRNGYGKYAEFLDRYFALHFGQYLVENFLEEKTQIDRLTEHERNLLSIINLPDIGDNIASDLDYVRARILASHNLGSKYAKGKVIMPFVTFLNHGHKGSPFIETEHGIRLGGQFEGEALACYHQDDSLAILRNHGFGCRSRLSFSLPMLIHLPDGRQLQIRREHKTSTVTPENFPWPVLEKTGVGLTLSWFPLYFEQGPRFPARVARYLAESCQVSGEMVMHAVYSYNFGQLFHLSCALRQSDNPYVQKVLAGLEVHIQQCTGMHLK